MPPERGHRMPSCAKQYAIAIEPTAVTSHDSNEIAPSCARFVGSMMIPDPIMLTATSVVRPASVIFLPGSVIAGSLLRQQAIDQITPPAGRGFEPQPVNVRLETGELRVELARVLQIALDRFRLGCDLLAGHDDGDAGRIRHDHHGNGASHQLVDIHGLDLAAH